MICFPLRSIARRVVLLSQRKADDYIEVELELDELDLTSAESKATYAEIKDYVLKEHGLKVSNLYIFTAIHETYQLPQMPILSHFLDFSTYLFS